MKKKEILVYLNVTIDGEVRTIQFQAEVLRAWLNELKIEPGQETVDLVFSLDGKSYTRTLNVKKEIPELKRAVKYAELIAEDIIPKSLQGYLTDLTQKLSNKKVCRVIGRDHEIEKAWFYLSQKTRNNVFLIGDKDVGKTAIATEIAKRIAIGECPKDFCDKRVLMLRPELLLKIENDYVYERKIKQLISFLVENKKKVILFVDKAIYMKTDINLIYILYACLKKYNIPLMVTSSEDNFEDYFYEDQSIAKYVNYIHIEEPELNEVEPMVRPYIRKLQKEYGIKISKKMIKYGIFTSELSDSVSANPGKVINIFERAFLNAKRKDKEEVDKQCILSCYDARIKEYSKMPEKEKRATAYHETGHYILSIMSKHRKNIKISCVSNLPMSYWAGVTMSYYDIEEYAVASKEYFLDYIAVALAGRIAEKKFTNLNSTGVAGDLIHANDVAKAMVMEWGFSENEHNKNRQYDILDYYLMPEEQKQLINREIQDIIDEGTRRAEEVINENEELLKIIAEKLLVEEILTGEELEAICNEYEEGKSNK